MLSVPVFDTQGKQTGSMDIDPTLLGGRIRAGLIKQAIVAFQDHQRQRSARTKGRSQTEGSTRKLYRQKGTGNARAGNLRTPIRRGGGHTFAKRVPGATKELPKKMRRMARNSALLAKIKSNDLLVLDGFMVDSPKTKPFASMLNAIGASNGCLFAMEAPNHHAYLSGRNIPDTKVRVLDELNAYEVMRGRKVVFTKAAFERLCADPMRLREQD